MNTSSTRVELWWTPADSVALDEDQRNRVVARLATRLDTSGRLRLVSRATRSQTQNKAEVTERFQRLLAEALRPKKKRKATRPTRASKEARLKNKKKRGEVKRERRYRGDE